ncbi:hypothetical protein [Moorena sp. SIO3H5]|nr:hypothetical protein [Moorena sp. SIO3H5]
MQSLMGETPKTALHRSCFLPLASCLFPIPCSLINLINVNSKN